MNLSWWVNANSYFEKVCRKKCKRHSRKVLWVVLSVLFFKEIWKNVTGGHGHIFASVKGKQEQYVRELQSLGTVYWSFPIFPFGIVAFTFFPTNLSPNSCILFVDVRTASILMIGCFNVYFQRSVIEQPFLRYHDVKPGSQIKVQPT